jgi:hypothetical protein
MPLPNGEPTAAEVVALGNRFLALKATPGWYDLVAIGDLMLKQARDAVQRYKGHDKEELFDLNRRAQIAEAFMTEFFGMVEGAIQNAQGLPGFQREDPRPALITTKIPGSY